VNVISVLIVDDHPMVREHVARAIDRHQRLELAGEAGDGLKALHTVEELEPDVVLLDLEIPLLDGAGVLMTLRQRHLPVRVLLRSGHASIVQMRNALRHRPDGLLLMDADADQICEELVAVETGGSLSAGRINLERAQLLVRNRVELSGREWEVLRLSAQGLTRAQTGEHLRFAASTVRDIRHDICTKLGAPTIQVAIVIALRIGLLE
jgi:DNA-binding NarL/FixJ family response regulator